MKFLKSFGVLLESHSFDCRNLVCSCSAQLARDQFKPGQKSRPQVLRSYYSIAYWRLELLDGQKMVQSAMNGSVKVRGRLPLEYVKFLSIWHTFSSKQLSVMIKYRKDASWSMCYYVFRKSEILNFLKKVLRKFLGTKLFCLST